MSYQPCNFHPFSLPDYLPLPPGVELGQKRGTRVPDPFLFDRGTAQFAPSTTGIPINMPRVQPNPPTKMSFATIQAPWAQFDLRWKAPCNVWSTHEVGPAYGDPRPDEYSDYGQVEGEKSDKSTALLTAAVVVAGLALLGMSRTGR